METNKRAHTWTSPSPRSVYLKTSSLFPPQSTNLYNVRHPTVLLAMAPTPSEVVQKLLANTMNADVLNEIVAPDATYLSLNYSNHSLKKVLPYAGTHEKSGPQAIIDTFTTVNTIWANEAFEVQAPCGSGEDVAVFGKITYRSKTLGKACTSPFSIWCKRW